MSNTNTKEYWDTRFSTGDWEEKGGKSQTAGFTKSQLKYFNIPKNFNGTILDFGCALGDSIPVLKKQYKEANLIGIDISDSAIKKCNSSFGDLAKFLQGDHNSVPNVDIIIASNVFEHLTNDISIAKTLLSKCKQLYIVVPYKEQLNNLLGEHINSYDEHYFKPLGKYDYKIFSSEGWGDELSFWTILIKCHLKNLIRPLLRKPKIYPPRQIMFKFIK